MSEWLTSLIAEVTGPNSTDGPYISIKRLGKQAFISYVTTIPALKLKFAYTPDGTKQDLSPSDWTITTVDEGQNITPKYTSIQVIELNSVTRVYISYYSGDSLRLATQVLGSVSWDITIIDNAGGVGDIGLYSSLFVSSTGQIFIAYHDDGNMPSPQLKYAFCGSSTIPPLPQNFEITTIFPDIAQVEYYGMYCSIAVNGTHVWISYQSYDSDNSGEKSLYLTWTSDGTDWNQAGLTNPFGGFVQPDADTPNSQTPIEHGFNTSIYNIGNSIYISHRELNSSGGNSLDKIRYIYSADCTGIGPTFNVRDSTVNSVNNNASQGGRQTSIQVDGNGKVQIVYFDDTAKNLMYSSTPDGTSSPTWTNVVVDSTGGDVGKYPSLSLGSGGFIAYFNETTGDMHFATNDDGSSGGGGAAAAGGGFPHLYSHDVSGAFVDASAVRSVANADVAELHAKLEPDIKIDDDAHVINIATKRALTITEFKQMFYSRGDDEFSIANVYNCTDVGSNILASVWGKRIESHAVGTLVNSLAPHGHGIQIEAEAVVITSGGAPLGEINFIATPAGVPAPRPPDLKVGMAVFFTEAPPQSHLDDPLVIHKIYYVVEIGDSGTAPGGHSYMRVSETKSGPYLLFSVSQPFNRYSYNYWQLVLPFNASRIMNYNKLSSRPNDPSGVDPAYGYANDLQRNFYASHEVMGYLERDLNIKNKYWTLCSKISIEDQLHNLSFSAESSDDVCMTISCARKWSEVEDALAESCLAENNIIGLGDYVDLYINVRIANGNPNTKDTLLRIRYTVQMTRGPDDLGNWNLVTAYIASAMLLTGIPYDQPEGGSFQYAANDPVETSPELTDRQRTQAPNTTAPANLSNVTDPADPTYTWKYQNSTTTIDLTGVSFINGSEGWCCGVSDSLILKTVNGGTTWIIDLLPGTVEWQAISMLNNAVGLVCGAPGTTREYDGTNWITPTGPSVTQLNDVHHIAANNAWVAGTDGKTFKWDGTNLTAPSSAAAPSNVTLFTIFMREANKIVTAGVGAGGPDGHVYWTNDSGATSWGGGSVSTEPIYSLFFVGSKGWSVGNNGTIMTSPDGGVNWTSQTSPTTAILKGVYFVDSLRGWAVGHSGTILITTDGGTNWVSQYSGTVEDLLSIHMENDKLGWIVGDNGTILKYS